MPEFPLIQQQAMRFAVVGLVSNAVLYLAYLGLTAAGIGPKFAMSLTYAIGVIQTFYFNRVWSFRHQDKLHPAFTRYVLAYAYGYLLNFFLLWLGVDGLSLPHQGVQAAAIVLVAINLFLFHRYWVFAPPAGKALN
jgi:putative flippase GtrA